MGDATEKFAWAVKNGEIDDVKLILEDAKKKSEGSKLVTSQYQGRHPIHLAADYGQREVMEYLIENGADINVEDKYNITPLLAAIYEGHATCVKLLLSKGAKKDGKAPDGSLYIDCAESDDIKALLR